MIAFKRNFKSVANKKVFVRHSYGLIKFVILCGGVGKKGNQNLFRSVLKQSNVFRLTRNRPHFDGFECNRNFSRVDLKTNKKRHCSKYTNGLFCEAESILYSESEGERNGNILIKYENITFNSIQIGHFALESVRLSIIIILFIAWIIQVYVHNTNEIDYYLTHISFQFISHYTSTPPLSASSFVCCPHAILQNPHTIPCDVM